MLLLLACALGLAAPFPHDLERPPPRPAAAASPAGTWDYDSWISRRRPAQLPERAAGWHSADSLYLAFDLLVRRHPGVVHPFLVGRTVRERPILGYRIASHTRPISHRLLVIAELHALEWIGPEVALAFAGELAEHPPPGLETVIVPIVNADGRALTESDLRAGRTHAYRRANAAGVDLNRDFAVNRENDSTWSKLPFFRSYYYTSPAALSQPETRAIDALASTGFEAAVSLHAFGGYIYAPWAGRYDPPADLDPLLRLGWRMAMAQRRPYHVKQLSHFQVWFRGLGMEVDHFHGRYGMKSYLVELTRSGIRPLHPSTWTDFFRWYNPVDPAPHVAEGLSALRALAWTLAW